YLKRSRYKRCEAKATRNLVVFEMVVTEYILDDNRQKIVKHNNLDLPYCRFSVIGEKGYPEYVAFSHKYMEQNSQPKFDGKEGELIHVIDPFIMGDPEAAKKWIRSLPKDVKKFASISVVDALGREYYNDPDWHTLIRNGTIFEPE